MGLLRCLEQHSISWWGKEWRLLPGPGDASENEGIPLIPFYTVLANCPWCPAPFFPEWYCPSCFPRDVHPNRCTHTHIPFTAPTPRHLPNSEVTTRSFCKMLYTPGSCETAQERKKQRYWIIPTPNTPSLMDYSYIRRDTSLKRRGLLSLWLVKPESKNRTQGWLGEKTDRRKEGLQLSQ